MANYYIDPLGNNGNAGTSSGVGNAWLDLSYAIANTGAGDTINCASGAYPTDMAAGPYNTSGQTILGPNAGIPYSGSRVTEAELDITTVINISVPSVIDGVKFVGTIPTGGAAAAPCIRTYVQHEANNSKILNNIFTGDCDHTFAVFSTGVTTAAPYILDGLEIKGNLFTGTNGDGVLLDPYSSLPHNSIIDNIVIQNNKFTLCGYGGIIGQGLRNANISNNIFDDCVRHIELKGGPATSVPSSAIIDSNTHISGSSSAYFMSFGNPADVVKIGANIVVSNNQLNFQDVMWGTVIVLSETDGITISENTLTPIGSVVLPLTFIGIVGTNLNPGTYTVVQNVATSTGSALDYNNGVTIDTRGGMGSGIIFDIRQNDFNQFQNGVFAADFNTSFPFDITPGGLPSGIQVTVKLNNLDGNVVGVNNGPGELIDARDCWWGDATGPSGGAIDPVTSGVAGGSGILVGPNVRFDPYYTAPAPPAPPTPDWTDTTALDDGKGLTRDIMAGVQRNGNLSTGSAQSAVQANASKGPLVVWHRTGGVTPKQAAQGIGGNTGQIGHKFDY